MITFKTWFTERVAINPKIVVYKELQEDAWDAAMAACSFNHWSKTITKLGA